MSEKEQQTADTTKILQERLKELNCIYGISTLIQDESIDLEGTLEKSMVLIQNAWQYPDITCVRIISGDKTFATTNFKETEWKQSAPISYRRKRIGAVEIYYLVYKETADEGPFLREERRLLNAVADLLSTYIEKQDINIKLNGFETKEKPIDKNDWEIILELLVKTDPRGALRITRRMIYYLYRIQNEEITGILAKVCPIDGKADEWCGINIPNPKEDAQELQRVQRKVFEIAKRAIPKEEISDLFQTWLKSDKGRPLLIASQKQGISLGEITSEINRYWDIPEDARVLMPEDERAISAGLIRRFFSGRLNYLNVAKDYIHLDDFVDLTKRIVGPSQGEGKLGGKSSGLYLAHKIVEVEKKRVKDLENIKTPKSWYLTSDSMMHLIRYNDLDDLINIKYLDPNEIRQEHAFLEQLFKNSVFPPDIISGLRSVLLDAGDHPIIVRSSSLLEDSFEAAFSGKYKSLFLVNTGTLEERLSNLMNAIAEIYASVFAPSPLEYRRERGLLEFSEEMSILIQEVVGTRIGPYFLPVYAGVSLCNNEFSWSPRIRREDGMVRLVSGLGTRAVDRVGDDYPVLMAPFRPEIRVNRLIDEAIQYSQRYIDVINVEKRTLETVDSTELLTKYWDEYPMVHQMISLHKEGMLQPARSVLIDSEGADMVITFDKMIEKTEFVPQIKALLTILKNKLETPVDIEFAYDGKNLYLLQCRPQHQALEVDRVPVPKNIAPNRKLFSANKYITTSHLENIEYLVYVDPNEYSDLKDRNQMLDVAKAVGILNKQLPKRRFILMGPGRWGSRGDIKLGVPVQYSDINNTSLLIEIARQRGGYQPDLSFGTHFFQDLVEADIHYMPLYPDETGNLLNEEFISMAPNRLAELVPKYKALEHVIKVVRISDVEDGGTMTVVMDGEANLALAYTVPADHWIWRVRKAEEIGMALDTELYGVEAMYLIGSSKDGTARAASDLDLVIHAKGSQDQTESLLRWLKGWDEKLAAENRERTGADTTEILDVHIVTDEDIAAKSSWAAHIGNPYNPAREIRLRKPATDE